MVYKVDSNGILTEDWGPHPGDRSRDLPSAASKERSTGRAKALFTSFEAWKKQKEERKTTLPNVSVHVVSTDLRISVGSC